jgi:protein dithiol oxidoreductase (disulfide-forming)
MKEHTTLGLIALLLLGISSAAHAAAAWREGVNYFLIEIAHPASKARGKVEVTEVFSYACPVCNQFLPTMHQLKQGLSADVVFEYVPASFSPDGDWPLFQRAFCTAQELGVAALAHDAVFDSVWNHGVLAFMDPVTERVTGPLPTMADIAKFYSTHTGVSAERFLSVAKSPAIDTRVAAAEKLVRDYRIDRTPTIVINGKYRLYTESAGGNDKLIELVKFLVAKESQLGPS